MLKFINKYFRKIEIYKLTPAILHDKKILCYGDLYNKLNVFNSEVKKYHYKNIRCNVYTLKKIENLLKNNLLNTKNKYSRMYKEPKLLSILAFDNLMYAPFVDESVPNDCIIKLLDGHKKYIPIDE